LRKEKSRELQINRKGKKRGKNIKTDTLQAGMIHMPTIASPAAQLPLGKIQL